MLYAVKDIINGEPTFKLKLSEILATLKRGGALEVLNAAEYNTKQQRAWWKGIFLPALAKDTGDSAQYWESVLKLAVMPDEFKPYYIPLGKQVFPVIPSITILSKKKMGLLMEGSVQHLRETPKYGDKFQWVTLPDSEQKKEKL